MSEVATRIANHETLKADAVKVSVKNGVVTLSGMNSINVDTSTASIWRRKSRVSIAWSMR